MKFGLLMSALQPLQVLNRAKCGAYFVQIFHYDFTQDVYTIHNPIRSRKKLEQVGSDLGSEWINLIQKN